MSTTSPAIIALAAARGFDLEKLMKKALARRPKDRKIPIKYADPTNPAHVWSGRGKQPTWFREAIAAGKKPDDFLTSPA
jgi:DNA-binding protein H-NS